MVWFRLSDLQSAHLKTAVRYFNMPLKCPHLNLLMEKQDRAHLGEVVLLIRGQERAGDSSWFSELGSRVPAMVSSKDYPRIQKSLIGFQSSLSFPATQFHWWQLKPR